MSFDRSLHVDEHLPTRPDPEGERVVVILTHGSLDRGSSFTRVVRRLSELHVITYDRRGYQRSRGDAPPGGLDAHIADLLSIAQAAGNGGERVVAVGHSFGGDVVIGAAIAEPRRFSAIGAFEPPMPWLGFRRDQAAGRQGSKRRWPPMDEDPGVEAEQFFRRMVGHSTWDRLSSSQRQERREDGPALVDDLQHLRGEPPFDIDQLTVPAVFGRGGPNSATHHRETVEWLASHVPGARLVEIEDSGHGAHLSHPDAFAQLVRLAVELGRRSSTTETSSAN
jgi:pimeloyl-ACP methyl ester carboxylesterase